MATWIATCHRMRTLPAAPSMEPVDLLEQRGQRRPGHSDAGSVAAEPERRDREHHLRVVGHRTAELDELVVGPTGGPQNVVQQHPAGVECGPGADREGHRGTRALLGALGLSVPSFAWRSLASSSSPPGPIAGLAPSWWSRGNGSSSRCSGSSPSAMRPVRVRSASAARRPSGWRPRGRSGTQAAQDAPKQVPDPAPSARAAEGGECHGGTPAHILQVLEDEPPEDGP